MRLAEGARVSLVAARPAEFALALLTETGSTAHVNKLQQIANGEGAEVKQRKRAEAAQSAVSSVSSTKRRRYLSSS